MLVVSKMSPTEAFAFGAGACLAFTILSSLIEKLSQLIQNIWNSISNTYFSASPQIKNPSIIKLPR
jgi:hypothetical protein